MNGATLTIAQMEQLTIRRMEPYDGGGWLCYPAGVEHFDDGNIGFGDTPGDAFNSWRAGENIGDAAWAKWRGLGML
jgi:hypothetical protein